MGTGDGWWRSSAICCDHQAYRFSLGLPPGWCLPSTNPAESAPPDTVRGCGRRSHCSGWRWCRCFRCRGDAFSRPLGADTKPQTRRWRRTVLLLPMRWEAHHQRQNPATPMSFQPKLRRTYPSKTNSTAVTAWSASQSIFSMPTRKSRSELPLGKEATDIETPARKPSP